MDADVDTDAGVGASGAHPEIAISCTPFLKCSKFANIFAHGAGNQSISTFDDDSGEFAHATSCLHHSSSFSAPLAIEASIQSLAS